MWVFLNDAMLSVVQPKDAGSKLLVRARLRGDLERAFPGCRVQALPNRGYRFRAGVERAAVAAALARAVTAVGYGNFKGSVADPERHDAGLGAWRVMFAEQGRQRRQPRQRHGEAAKPTATHKVNAAAPATTPCPPHLHLSGFSGG